MHLAAGKSKEGHMTTIFRELTTAIPFDAGPVPFPLDPKRAA